VPSLAQPPATHPKPTPHPLTNKQALLDGAKEYAGDAEAVKQLVEGDSGAAWCGVETAQHACIRMHGGTRTVLKSLLHEQWQRLPALLPVCAQHACAALACTLLCVLTTLRTKHPPLVPALFNNRVC
jgi:hypothetical protein